MATCVTAEADAPAAVAAATWGFAADAVGLATATCIVDVAVADRPAPEAAAPTSTEALLSGVARSTNAVVLGIEMVERDPGVQTVGIHSFPNSSGYLQLDAAILELDATARTARFGAVMGLEGYAGAIRPAAVVMRDCPHTNLVGAGAGDFARDHGLQPSAAPLPVYDAAAAHSSKETAPGGHDTVGLLCLDAARGTMTVGCSSSGMRGKHPGRVGDSPVFGSGLYGETGVGGAVCTGDGDQICTFPLAFVAVAGMKRGLQPDDACRVAIEAFAALPQCPSTAEVGVCAVGWDGTAGGACSPAWRGTFQVAVATHSNAGVAQTDVRTIGEG